MLLEQSVMRDDAILVHGDIKIVCVDKQSMKPRRMPREIIDAMRVGV